MLTLTVCWTPETATAAVYKFRLKVYLTSVWNICSIWLFYKEFECSSSRVTFHVKLSRYLINVQRTQLMLMDVQNCAVIKPLLGDGTSHIGFQSAQTWEATLSLDTTGRRTSCSTWSNIDLTTDGIETSEATVYGLLPVCIYNTRSWVGLVKPFNISITQ